MLIYICLAMQTIKITTTQNIDIEYEVATLGERFLARVVDMGVMIGVYYIMYIIIIAFFVTQIGQIQAGGGIPTMIIIIAQKVPREVAVITC